MEMSRGHRKVVVNTFSFIDSNEQIVFLEDLLHAGQVYRIKR